MRKYMKMLAYLMAAIYMVSCQKDPIFEEVSSLTTLDATDVSINSAVLNGELDLTYWRRDNIQVEYVGFYISTSSDFNSEDTEYYEQYSSSSSSPNFSFSQEVRGLKENTTYYYYAYARKWANEAVIKGAVKSFTTSPLIAPQGAIRGLFAVSYTQKVFISKGNLQYRASSKTWRFAEHQYDCIGDANSNISATYSGWIDLFGWGTSGCSNKYPYMTSGTYSDYILWNSISGTNYDWGVYNAISNGGNRTGLWRTLTRSEWAYLCRKGDGCSDDALATVCGVHGYILLPLSFTMPSGVEWVSQALNWSTNIYNAQTWSKMEEAGAVFLPAAGCRAGSSVISFGTEGQYWSSTRESGEGPQFLKFNETTISAYYYYYLSSGYYGCSVRLVQDYQ